MLHLLVNAHRRHGRNHKHRRMGDFQHLLTALALRALLRASRAGGYKHHITPVNLDEAK